MIMKTLARILIGFYKRFYFDKSYAAVHIRADVFDLYPDRN